MLAAWKRLFALLLEDQRMISDSWCLQRHLCVDGSNKPGRR